MGKEDVPDPFLLTRGAVQPQTTRVNGYGFVDEIAADVLARGSVAHRRSQDSDLHDATSSATTRPCNRKESIWPFPFTWMAPRLSNSNLPFKRSYTLRVT